MTLYLRLFIKIGMKGISVSSSVTGMGPVRARPRPSSPKTPTDLFGDADVFDLP
jgi:hypothetical protein